MAKITITQEKFQFTYKQHNGLKRHKFIDLFNQRTGRIKRMRSRRESRYVKPLKRLVKSLDIFDNTNIFYPINRWNRH